MLSLCLQIVSLWANHHTNNDASKRVRGHYVLEILLSCARRSSVNFHSGLISQEPLSSDFAAEVAKHGDVRRPGPGYTVQRRRGPEPNLNRLQALCCSPLFSGLQITA